MQPINSCLSKASHTQFQKQGVYSWVTSTQLNPQPPKENLGPTHNLPRHVAVSPMHWESEWALRSEATTAFSFCLSTVSAFAISDSISGASWKAGGKLKRTRARGDAVARPFQKDPWKLVNPVCCLHSFCSEIYNISLFSANDRKEVSV